MERKVYEAPRLTEYGLLKDIILIPPVPGFSLGIGPPISE